MGFHLFHLFKHYLHVWFKGVIENDQSQLILPVFGLRNASLDLPSLFFFFVSVRKLTVSVHGRAALQWQRQYKFMLSGTSRNVYVHFSVCGLVGGLGDKCAQPLFIYLKYYIQLQEKRQEASSSTSDK